MFTKFACCGDEKVGSNFQRYFERPDYITLIRNQIMQEIKDRLFVLREFWTRF